VYTCIMLDKDNGIRGKAGDEAITLTPSTLYMRVIARTGDAVYLRLPKELQRSIEGGCNCPQCKADPTLAQWDTLVVSTDQRSAFSSTVHMPDGCIAGFVEYCARKAKGVSR